jgi:hypothetical protein
MTVAINITEILHGKIYADELKFVPLSNNSVSKQIREISNNMHEQLMERIFKKKIAGTLVPRINVGNVMKLGFVLE